MKKIYTIIMLLVLATVNNSIYAKPISNYPLQNSTPNDLISFTVNYDDGKDLVKWIAPYDPSINNFEIERSTNGDIFFHVDYVNPQSKDIGTKYEYRSATVMITGVRYYRIKINYVDGTYQYSSIIKLDDDINKRITVRYNGTKQLQLSLPYNLRELNIVNGSGQVLRRYTDLPAGLQVINMDNLQGGIYWLQCMGDKFENIEVDLNP
jgi:hypothetical protein